MSSSQAQRNLFVSYIRSAEVQEALKQALTLYRQALPIIEKLAAHDPVNVQLQNDLAWTKEQIEKLE